MICIQPDIIRGSTQAQGCKHRPRGRRPHLAAAARNRWRTPIDQNGLSRCVQGELVYEPDTASCIFPFRNVRWCGAGCARGRAAAGGEPSVRRADRGAAGGRRASAAPTASSCASSASMSRSPRTRRSSTRALQQAYRRSAADPADGDAAGAAARARPDGERHRARHQQRHLAGRALHRSAAGDASRNLSARAREHLRDHPARHRGRGADRGAHARVLPPARAASDARARWSSTAGRAGAAS